MDFKEVFGEELAAQIEGVVKEKGVNLIIDDKEKPNFIPKDRFNEVIGSKNELKTQVSELTNQLDTLKKSAKGNDDLVAKIEELQNNSVDAQNRYNKSLIDNAIKMEAIGNKAIDPKDLAKFLDYTTLKLDDDGNVEGLGDQFLALKESKPYLFEAEKTANNNNASNPTNVVVQKNLDEQYQEALKNGNQTLAIALKNRMFNI